jgi:cbb3-type cytochrome oxidase subunit 3
MTHFWNSIVHFFNSSFFIAIVTLVVGTAAYIVYRIQKRDKKREAANIILLEIQSAERKLGQIKSSLAKDPPSLPNDLRLLPTENWSSLRYLFIRDFDRDEWDALTGFYNKCELIDETIKYNNAAFWSDVEQIRANKQRILADFAKVKTEKPTGDTKTDEATIQEFNEITEKFDTTYMGRQGRFSYTPDKTIIDARLYMTEIDLGLSKSVIGTKLKRLASIEV